MDSNQQMSESKSDAFTTWLQAYINGGCCTLYTSIETTNKHRCRHQSSKGKPFVQQHLILTLLAQSTAFEADTFQYASLSRRASDLLSLLCISLILFIFSLGEVSALPSESASPNGADGETRTHSLRFTRALRYHCATPA